MSNYNSIHTGQQIDNFNNRITTNTENIAALMPQVTTLMPQVTNMVNSLNKINIYSATINVSDWTWYSNSNAIIQDYDATTYDNKWTWEKYDQVTMTDNILTTLESLPIISTVIRNDPSGATNVGDYYTAKCTTYLYCDQDYTWTSTGYTDDAGKWFLNGELIGSTNVSSTTMTFHFKEGENILICCYTEGSGDDTWYLSPCPSTVVGSIFTKMSAIPVGGYTVTVTPTLLGNSTAPVAKTILTYPQITNGNTLSFLEDQRILGYYAKSYANSNGTITIETVNGKKPSNNITVYWFGYG